MANEAILHFTVRPKLTRKNLDILWTLNRRLQDQLTTEAHRLHKARDDAISTLYAAHNKELETVHMNYRTKMELLEKRELSLLRLIANMSSERIEAQFERSVDTSAVGNRDEDRSGIRGVPASLLRRYTWKP